MGEKYFVIKVPYEDETESKAFCEILTALCNGYYAGTDLYGCSITAKQIPDISEGFDVPAKYFCFYEYKILVNKEDEARQLSSIISNIADCMLGADFIYYDFRNCID